jgi:hypothetical protein
VPVEREQRLHLLRREVARVNARHLPHQLAGGLERFGELGVQRLFHDRRHRSGTLGCAFFMESITWFETIIAICAPSGSCAGELEQRVDCRRGIADRSPGPRPAVERANPVSVSAAISRQRGT